MSNAMNPNIPQNQNSSVQNNMYSYGNRNIPLSRVNNLLNSTLNAPPVNSSSESSDRVRDSIQQANNSLQQRGFSNLGGGAYLDPNNNVIRPQQNPQFQQYQRMGVPIPQYFMNQNGYNYNGQGTPLGGNFNPQQAQAQQQYQQNLAMQQQRLAQLQARQGRGTIPQAYIDRQAANFDRLKNSGGY